MKWNWNKIKRIADRNALFLENIPEDFIDGDVEMSEEELVNLLWLLIDDMEAEDGKIKKSRKNLFMINQVDNIFRSFALAGGLLLLTKMIGKFQKVVANVFSYFGEIIGQSSKFDKAKKSVLDLVNRRLGIKDGEAVKGGYVSDLLEMTEVKNQTKELLYQNILSEPSPTALKKSIKEFISGSDEDKRGAIRKFYARFTGSSFTYIDRMATFEFATAYGLTQFIYYGTIIKTSRAFCRKKIHGIYTIEEGLKWPYENPKPLGISNATYNPVIDMGGENCRHVAFFLTDEMADEMRGKGFSGFNG